MKTKVNNKKRILVIILLLLIILVLGFAYSRYLANVTGRTDIDMAKICLKVNGATNTNFSIDLADTKAGINQEIDIREGFIGPGNAGAFEIEVDGTGSEASFVYDINLNVDNGNNILLPKNLIFYQDSEMTTALAHENNVISIKGFIGYDDENKVQTKTIYWKWNLETGITEEEKNANDELDSAWIGRNVSISMNVKGKQVAENDLANNYQVTFDANGGTLQGYGNASKATKQVTYGEVYGYLPTPTREGYTFRGWNGKNLFDMSGWLDKFIFDNMPARVNAICTIENRESITISGGETNDSYTCTYGSTEIYFRTQVKPSTTYTISASTDRGNGRAYVFVNGIVEPEGTNRYMFWFPWGNSNYKTFITPSNAEFVNIRFGVYNKGSKKYSNIQIEEGSAKTTYEPYILSSSTPVTQNNNHILTAIWEPVSNQ